MSATVLRSEVAHALRAAIESPDPFPPLRTLLAALTGEHGPDPDPSPSALIRDLRDVGTDKIAHDMMGCCPNVRGEGQSTADDRDQYCAACAVLKRADAYLVAEHAAGFARPPLADLVRSRLGPRGRCWIEWPVTFDHPVPVSVSWRRHYASTGEVSDERGPAASATVDAALRAVLAHEDAADAREPEHAGPVTQPGPTEKIDRDLRYVYFFGCFVLPGEPPHVAKPEHHNVRGLRVRITYTYHGRDVEAAEACAETWQVRLRERGAASVVCVGEEVGT